jgi:uncharacterized membrane protein
MRLLALAGLSIALFLLGVHVAEALAVGRAKLPFCSWATWLDCASVLSSPRYSKWFGAPVSALAAGVYLLVIVGLWRRWGGVLDAAAVVMAVAAGWFIYVQLAVLHRVCVYCMTEHAIGLLLAFLIWLHMQRPRRWGAGLIGVALGAAMVMGQLAQPIAYAAPITIGQITINPADHPRLGPPGAKHLIIEAIDYTCPRCQAFSLLLRDALKNLGPDYGVVVLTFPLNGNCNPLYADVETEPRHRDACELARLAHAVFARSPERFETFHNFLFDHQDHMTVGKAMVAADEPADGGGGEAVRRDVAVATKLGVKQLPGVFVGQTMLQAIPEDADTLAMVIRAAFQTAARETPGKPGR